MSDRGTEFLERRMGDWARARLPSGAAEFVMFVLKQGWAALFGIALLLAMLASKAVWQADWAVARYDALVLFALVTQALFLMLRLETPAEARVILLFHLTGTAMEIFKIRMGSWNYPEPGLIRAWGVPLFSGFMYASVGSFMARVVRIFEMRFAPFPPLWTVWALAALIYANFFAHHYLPDIRWALFAGTVILFWRTRIWFYIHRHPRWMPLPVAALLSSFFLWIAENIGTYTGTWVYARGEWEVVSLAKMGSWYLLLYVAFATVTIVVRDMLSPRPLRPAPRGGTVGTGEVAG